MSEPAELARERIARVFRFLKAFHELRNPVARVVTETWHLWLDEAPVTPVSWAASIGEAPNAADADQAEDPNLVLRVRRPDLTECPTPPAVLNEWLEDGWRNPDQPVVVLANRPVDGNEGDAEAFEQSPARVEALKTWEAKRASWAKAETPLRRAYQLFQRLYELHGQLRRESERFELVLGDGNLVWKHAAGDAHHPVLLQPVQLEFDPDAPEFRITEVERETELDSALLTCFPGIEGERIAECREEAVRGKIHPLLELATNGFLSRLALQLSGKGRFVEGDEKPTATEDPQFYRRPVLFRRARAAGFARVLESILHDIDAGSELPYSLRRIVGIDDGEAGGDGRAARFEAGDVLLSKEANPEQFQIVQRLHDHGSVLVQGPPGTGKSHTIANLIGHLLAHGQSVLVTSHTTKALGVLRSHVVEELRPLCVSVLDSDVDSRRQLEDAVTNISQRLSNADRDELRSEADGLEAERATVRQRLAAARAALRDARLDEQRDVVLAGRSWSPCDAARLVAEGAGKHDWIPGKLEPGAPIAVTAAEVEELYRSNEVVSPTDEQQLAEPLPDFAALPRPSRFDELVRPVAAVPMPDRAEWWVSGPEESSPEEISEVGRRLVALGNQMSSAPEWQRDAAAASLSVSGAGHPWEGLAARIDEAVATNAASSDLLMRYDVWLPEEGAPEEHESIAGEIAARLEANGSLGLFAKLGNRKWARFINEARVSGGEPRTLEHFQALKAEATLQRLRAELAKRWTRLMEPGRAPTWQELGRRPEIASAQFASDIRRALEWKARRVDPEVERLRALGFRWEPFIDGRPAQAGERAALDRVLQAIHAMAPVLDGRIDAALRSRKEREFRQFLSQLKAAGSSGSLQTELVAAVESKNARAYRSVFDRVVALTALRGHARRRAELQQKIERVAPGWADSIRQRSGAHGQGVPPGDPEPAWTWAQIRAELEDRASKSLGQLQARVEVLERELRRVTVQLIDRRAWGSQLERTSLRQRQSLVGWLDMIRRIGKGTGKRAPALRAEAARQMRECRSAVPVWIMPLSRVADTFDSGARFDVVIVDEASQSDVMGLVALYLGRKVVVVGDHEQVSPSAVGQQVDRITQLIDQHLVGIPNSKLYDGKTSVYDLARQSFGGLICLTEHFRCYPEIIEFSNWLSYNGTIKALREPGANAITPFVVPYQVGGAERSGKVNRTEAVHVASLIAACAAQPEYESKTFGVVSLLGDEQAVEIDRLLRDHLPEPEYVRRRILCGNAAHFQGDERDVMFLSVVHASSGAPLRMLNDTMYQQRFNVAASRARDQMWVVHSLNHSLDLQPGDLRRRLIEHALDPTARARELEKKSKRTESDFERKVLERLVARGYVVHPQHSVGAYRIDLVVEGARARLAVECDGERYHTPDNLDRDMARQAILERLGWQFARIRGSHFYRDPDGALEPVFERLAELGIEPDGQRAASPRGSDVQTRVLAAAAELRARWSVNADVTPPAEVATDGSSLQPVSGDRNRPSREPAGVATDEAGQVIEIASLRLRSTTAALSENVPDSAELLVPVAGEQLADPPAVRAPRADPAAPRLAHPPSAARLRAILDPLAQLIPIEQRQCPVCGSPVALRVSGFGPYLPCSNRNCDGKHHVDLELTRAAVRRASLKCECGGTFDLKRGKTTFLGCDGYPACRTAISWREL